jgi:type I restriction enzyme R subunit
MIFAAYKLRRHPALHNPTVMIVVDRRDLKTQLSDDFDACDYPNVEKAMGVEDLKRKLRTDWRGTCVTTIQSFQRMDDLAPRQRDNIISLVDECHRTQKGDGTKSYAMTMRVKLPQAFRFGFTGTPIDRTMLNTHRDFGPLQDGVQERYLSYYGIKRANQGRRNAGGALHPGQSALPGGRGNAERCLRGHVRRHGARG